MKEKVASPWSCFAGIASACDAVRPAHLWIWLSSLAFFLTALTPRLAHAVDSKRVLIVYTENRLVPGLSDLDDGIRLTLQQAGSEKLETFAEFIDTTRFPEKSHEDLLVAYLQEKYRSTQPDVVIAVRSGSLGFLCRHRQELFPRAVIVHASVPVADVNVWKDKTSIVGVPIDFDFQKVIQLGLRLHPLTERVVVITGATQREKDIAATVRKQEPEWHLRSQRLPNIRAEFWSGWPLADILTHLSALPPDALVVSPGMWQDGAGQWFVPVRALSRMVEASPAPVYGMFSSQLGSGVVGTFAPQMEEVGREAATIALRILHGESPSQLNLPASFPNTYLFDWQQLQRWGISTSQLPADSIVLFREPTLWERYKWILVFAVLLVLVQSALIVGFLLMRRRRRAAEALSQAAAHETRELRQELAHTGRVLVMGELSGALAHELNQPLAAILSNAQAAMHLLDEEVVDFTELKDVLEDIVSEDKRAGHVIERLRALMRKRTSEFQAIDLNEVAEDVLDLVKSELIADRVVISTQLTPMLPMIWGDRIQLQQVVLNLVKNAAEAMTNNGVRDRSLQVVTMIDSSGYVCLSVSDSGPGISRFEAERVFEPFFTTKTQGLGIGLPICRTILKEHRGRIWGTNNGARGATFYLALPAYRVTKASA